MNVGLGAHQSFCTWLQETIDCKKGETKSKIGRYQVMYHLPK